MTSRNQSHFDTSRKSTVLTAVVAVGIAGAINFILLVLIHHLNNSGFSSKKLYEVKEVNLSKIMPQALQMPKPEKTKPPKKKRPKPKLLKKKIIQPKRQQIKKVQPKNLDFKIDMKLTSLPALSYVNVAPPAPLPEPQDIGADEYQIFDLNAVDRHPQALFRSPPLYPPAAKRLGLEGWVSLEFIVDEEGNVSEVEVKDASSRRFHQAAVSCIQSWRFKPAIKDKKAVPCMCTQKLTFQLSN